MRTVYARALACIATVSLVACAHQPAAQTATATPQGTAIVVMDAGQALIYRVEQRGPWQVFATARSLDSLPDAGVRAVDKLDLDAPLRRTAEHLIDQLRANGAKVERADAPLPSLRTRYAQVLVLAVQRAGVAQARETGDWPRAVYAISARMIDLERGTTLWRSTAEQVLDLPLADVVEGVPEAGAETLLRSSQQANADLMANVLARMGMRDESTGY